MSISVRPSEYGDIPAYWDISSLGSISVKITDGAHASPKGLSAGKYMCSVKDMSYGKFDFADTKLISEEDFQNLERQGCRPKTGDILISKDGAKCLDLIFVYRQPEEIVLLSSVAIVRLNEDTSSDFVRYFLLSPACQFIMKSNFVSGSAIPRVVLKDFRDVSIPLPPLREQEAIAEVLSSLDDKIDLLHRQNATLEALAETLFRQIFIEEAQDDWEELSLPEFLDFKEGPGIRNWQYTDHGVRFLNIRLLNDGEIDVEKANHVSTEEGNKKYAHFHLKEGDMVMSTSGTLGKHAIIRDYHLPVILNTSIIRFRPNDGHSYAFMYQYLQSEIFQSDLSSMASGSVQLNFGPTHLKQMTITMPSQEVLNLFEAQAGPYYRKLERNFKQIQTLKKLRDTLLPKLMSGEVRVALDREAA